MALRRERSLAFREISALWQHVTTLNAPPNTSWIVAATTPYGLGAIHCLSNTGSIQARQCRAQLALTVRSRGASPYLLKHPKSDRPRLPLDQLAPSRTRSERKRMENRAREPDRARLQSSGNC